MSIDTKALKERIYALEADLGTAQHADHEETIRALVVAADRLAELEAARLAYASEFPLNAEGEPDVDNIHQNIRALLQRLAELEAENDRLKRDVDGLVELTMELEEHPDGYDGPCMCKLCQSYLDVDEEALAAGGDQ